MSPVKTLVGHRRGSASYSMANPNHTPVKLPRQVLVWRTAPSERERFQEQPPGAAAVPPSPLPRPPTVLPSIIASPIKKGGLRRGSMVNAVQPSTGADKLLTTREELHTMTIRDLKQVLPAGDDYRPVDKTNLADHLIETGAVELVSCYTLSYLRGLSAVQLRRCLTTAGVSFDARYVVEKEDMIRVFYASGKLRIISEEEEEGEEEMCHVEIV
ncbi:hypothetical protein ACA910_020482 [Epithemia clementina (nom. ined.)]